MKLRAIGLCWFAMALMGCGELDHGDYIDARSDAECSKYRTCIRGYFESEFRDQDDCVKERGDFLDDIDDNRDKSCDYDGAEGRSCVSRINGMTCEEFVEQGSVENACDLVWTCN